MKKIINEKNKKVHYLKEAHRTLCNMSDQGVEGYSLPAWTETDQKVTCRLCLRKKEKG